MHAVDKARIRIEHHLHHVQQHIREYETLAETLARTGQVLGAVRVRAVADLQRRAMEQLRLALEELGVSGDPLAQAPEKGRGDTGRDDV